MQTQSDKHCAQPQHLALPTSTGWRSSARGRMAHTAVAAVMAGLLAFPGVAMAVDYVTVDGSDQYTEAQDDVAGAYGGTWSWDGDANMTLDNYSGTGINAGNSSDHDDAANSGDLNIELVGDNTITSPGIYGINMDAGSDTDSQLTISGDGSLDITAKSDTYSFGINSKGADVVIDGATVKVDSSSCSIHSDTSDTVIKNGADVTANSGDFAAIHAGNGGVGSVIISDSTVNATCTANNGVGILSNNWGTAEDASTDGISIADSNINAIGGQHAIFSTRSMSLVNSEINAGTVQNGVSSQAEAGSSSGAAIAAQGAINLVDVDFGGASVMTDSQGVSYIGNPDGSPATSVAAKNTGAASKFVNGVGRTETAETGGSATGTATGTSGSGVTAGSARLASTGGNVAKMLDEVTAVTSDPTSMATVAATLFGGIGLAVTGIFSRKRSK